MNRINDHMLVYANDTDELVIQNVNKKHIYIEIEDKCSVYNSIDEMKDAIKKYSISIKGNSYNVLYIIIILLVATIYYI